MDYGEVWYVRLNSNKFHFDRWTFGVFQVRKIQLKQQNADISEFVCHKQTIYIVFDRLLLYNLAEGSAILAVSRNTALPSR